MFGNLFKRPLALLVTATVEPSADGFWMVTWIPNMVGRRLAATPGNFSETSLNRAAEKASSEVARLYSGSPEASSAELQLAIYPWPGDGDAAGQAILDVLTSAEDLRAIALADESVVAEAATLEALVTSCEPRLPVPADAMLRWVRRVVELPL